MELRGSRFAISERFTCRVLEQLRAVQRYVPTVRTDEDALTQANVALAAAYRRYGCRRITVLLQAGSWQIRRNCVQRIWRRKVFRENLYEAYRNITCCPMPSLAVELVM